MSPDFNWLSQTLVCGAGPLKFILLNGEACVLVATCIGICDLLKALYSQPCSKPYPKLKTLSKDENLIQSWKSYPNFKTLSKFQNLIQSWKLYPKLRTLSNVENLIPSWEPYKSKVENRIQSWKPYPKLKTL